MRLTKHIFNSISRHAKTCLPSLPLGLLTRAFPRPSRTMVAAFDPKTTGVLAEFWNELVSSDRSQTSPSTEQISAVRARLISVGGSNLNDRQICGWFERPDLKRFSRARAIMPFPSSAKVYAITMGSGTCPHVSRFTLFDHGHQCRCRECASSPHLRQPDSALQALLLAYRLELRHARLRASRTNMYPKGPPNPAHANRRRSRRRSCTRHLHGGGWERQPSGPLMGPDQSMGPGGLATPEAGGCLRAPPQQYDRSWRSGRTVG